MERLQKVIANNGYCSRRKAEELIAAGKVKVNGVVIKELGVKVKDNDDITVEGNHLSGSKKEYYLLYKPEKIISSTSDEHNRKTVVNLIETSEKIYPIGRLDYDTSGIILLTNDGELTNILAHPRNCVPKTYVAKINGILNKEQVNQLKKGLIVDNRMTNIEHFKIKKCNYENKVSTIELTLIEGRNHIVKNIFKSLGYKVLKLKRTSYGFLDLTGLKKGEYRQLSIKEIKTLYAYKQK